MTNAMETITLKRTGDKMPLTGFGLWKVDRATCADTVEAALAVGYRLLDGAGDYGNEKEAGEGLARAINKGIVKREEVFVTSKLWNAFHAPEHVAQLARHQLKLWGVEYFDLFLIHFPVSLKYVDPAERYPPEWWGDAEKTHINLSNVPLQATWEAMEKLVDEGLVRNIGVSNYNGALLLDLQRYARIEPAVLQIEHHPYLVQQPLVDLVKTLGIAVTAYSSYGPQTWLELDMHHSVPSLLENNVITTISKKHGKTPANVLLRWATQRGLAVIPKSNSLARVKENFQSADFVLTEEEIKQISSLDRGLRLNDPASIDIRLSIFA